MDIQDLRQKAQEIRLDTIALSLEHKDGHVASSFSFIEIMVTLYEMFLREEDQFILSKGHGVFSLYALLRKKGYQPTILGHPDIEPEQGIVCTTGSLGHGISVAAGKAFARKIMQRPGKVYVVVGDGECQEGSVWETLNIVNRYSLDNLVIIVDHNKLQAMDTVEHIMHETNLKKKFEAFGANVIEIDGHNYEEIIEAFEFVAKNRGVNLILANTLKGKGICFMQQDAKWQSRLLAGDEYEQAKFEIEKTI